MNQLITATYEDGVLKPHESLDLATGAKVRLLITPCGASHTEDEDALAELVRLCDDEPIHAGGKRLINSMNTLDTNVLI